MEWCLAGSTFSEKASSKEEAASLPPAAEEELNNLPPPPDGAVIADKKGETKNAEILKSHLNEDEKIEVMDDEAPQTEGKKNISVALTETVTSWFVVESVHWLPDHWYRILSEVLFLN